LALIAANQFTRQLPKPVQETIGVNAGTKIAFRGGDKDDSKILADNLPPLSTDDFLHLPQYTVAARVMSSTGPAPVVTLNTPKPPAQTGFEQYIIERSRRLYGRPVDEVEAELLKRHESAEPKKRPKIGDMDL
jgi:hypothetical protein